MQSTKTHNLEMQSTKTTAKVQPAKPGLQQRKPEEGLQQRKPEEEAYLKNIVVSFVRAAGEGAPAAKKQQALLPALATILRFSTAEQAECRISLAKAITQVQ
jgi:hypothetical protein